MLCVRCVCARATKSMDNRSCSNFESLTNHNPRRELLSSYPRNKMHELVNIKSNYVQIKKKSWTIAPSTLSIKKVRLCRIPVLAVSQSSHLCIAERRWSLTEEERTKISSLSPFYRYPKNRRTHRTPLFLRVSLRCVATMSYVSELIVAAHGRRTHNGKCDKRS